MGIVVSCGVVIADGAGRIFVCHATGTARWDLPKGLQDPGESPLETALRETWEETSLRLDPATLHELGLYDYLPGKRLHLYALHAAADAFDPAACRCHSTFPHRITGKPTPEADGYAWQPLDRLADWCGKNMTRVLSSIDWAHIGRLPVVARIEVGDPPGEAATPEDFRRLLRRDGGQPPRDGDER